MKRFVAFIFIGLVTIGLFYFARERGHTATEVIGLVRQDCTGFSNCYTSLSAWEAAYGGVSFGACAQGDLVCADKTATAQIDGTWTTPDSTAVNVNGWTTDVNHYINFYTTSVARHAGVWDTNKYQLTSATYAGFLISITGAGHVRIDGLQLSLPQNNNGAAAILANYRSVGSDIRISNNIFRKASGANAQHGTKLNTDSNSGQGGDFRIWNNIVYDFTGTGSSGFSMGIRGNFYAYNNTVVNGTTGFGGGNTTTVLKNNIASGNTADYSGTFSASSNYNLASNGTATGGANDRINQVVSFANSTSKDFHLSAGDTAAKDFGVDLSADGSLALTTDIDGQTRTGSWDIGSDEQGASSGGDTQAPSIPSGLAASGITASSLTLNWTASTDNVGVRNYIIYRNGSPIATVAHPATTYPDTGLSSNTSYTYTVAADDVAGNVSAQSTSVLVTTQAGSDTTPPVRSNGAPSGNLSAGTTQTTISLDTNEIATCKYGTVAGTAYASLPNTFSTTNAIAHSQLITGLTNGTSYTYYVRCQDAGTNVNPDDFIISFSVSMPGAGATYYISPTGSDTNAGTSAAPWKTFSKAFTTMQGSDILILKNGTYTQSTTGLINDDAGGFSEIPPAGTVANPTIVKSENDFQATLDGQNITQPVLIYTRGNMQFEGLRFKDGPGAIAQLYRNAKYITIKRSSFTQSVVTQGNYTNVGIGGTTTDNNNNAYILLEDIWISGAGRYMFNVFNSSHVTVRRAVVRRYGNNTPNPGNPQSGFTIYNTNDSVFENIVAIDGSEYTSDTDRRGIYMVGNSGIFPNTTTNNNKILGCVALNNDVASQFAIGGSSGGTGNLIQNCVFWGSSNFATTGTITSVNGAGFTGNTISNVTMGVGNYGWGNFNSANTTIKNVIFQGIGTAGANNQGTVNLSYAGRFNTPSFGATCTLGCITTNPSLLYLTRIESTSPYKGAGEAGADIGANILYKYGTDGSRVGDAGVETLTTNNIWPWPYEAQIKSDICGVATASGLCATTKTLTAYIWEYLGNTCPVSVCGGSSDTQAPSIPSGLAASGITASSLTLNWTASTDNVGVNHYRVFRNGTQVSNNSTQTTTTFNDIGLSPSTAYTYTVSAVDAAGNVSAQSTGLNVATQSGGGVTYYISPTGNDANAGTSAAPWRTFGKAFSTMTGGQTLVLKNGDRK